jgi:hypothetical protein
MNLYDIAHNSPDWLVVGLYIIVFISVPLNVFLFASRKS